MTGAPQHGTPGGPVVTEDWAGLAEYGCKLRLDWDEIEWLGLAVACGAAGIPFRDGHREVMRLAWETGTSNQVALDDLAGYARAYAERHALKGEQMPPGAMEALRAGKFAVVRDAFKTVSAVPRQGTASPAETKGDPR